jgi:hypothetical protein
MQSKLSRRLAPPAQRGSALLASMLTLTGIAVLSASVLTTSLAMQREQRGDLQRLQVRYAGEAAVAAALVDLELGGPGQAFSAQAPLRLGGADAWAGFTVLAGDQFSADGGARLGHTRLGLEVIAESVSQGLFQFGAFGEDGVWLASNAQVDSYDSELAPYAALNNNGSSAYCDDDGAVGSNADIEVSQNAKVWGQLAPGPGGTATVLGNAVVSGGAYASPAPTILPPIQLPTYTPGGNLVLANNAVQTLAPGNYDFGQFQVGKNAKLTIQGPANLVVTNLEVLTGSSLRIDSTSGPVTIYVENDFLIDSNTLIAPLDLDPKGLSFQLLSDNIVDPLQLVDVDLLDFDSNAKMYASIYAPNALVEINSNFELFGAVMAKELILDSNCKIHYDESLADADIYSTSTFEVIGWREKGHGQP